MGKLCDSMEREWGRRSALNERELWELWNHQRAEVKLVGVTGADSRHFHAESEFLPGRRIIRAPCVKPVEWENPVPPVTCTGVVECQLCAGEAVTSSGEISFWKTLVLFSLTSRGCFSCSGRGTFTLCGRGFRAPGCRKGRGMGQGTCAGFTRTLSCFEPPSLVFEVSEKRGVSCVSTGPFGSLHPQHGGGSHRRPVAWCGCGAAGLLPPRLAHLQRLVQPGSRLHHPRPLRHGGGRGVSG